MHFDLVLSRGRVIDPESGLDAVRDVGICRDKICAVSTEPLSGTVTIMVNGAVVSPGFIDLHSHCQEVPGQRLQALDGVTTALELEAGLHPIDEAYERAGLEGRPLNYGFSTSWATARMRVLAGRSATGSVDDFFANLADPRWQRSATRPEVDRILELLENDLAAGALGIGILVGYAPRTDPSEYLAVAALAARNGRPTFTHARDLVEFDSSTTIDGAEEIVRAAGETGGHMHYCHVNSTSLRQIDRVLGLVERVRAEGGTVTTEAYPYGAGMTGVGASYLAPEHLHRRELTAHSIGLLGLGRRMRDAEEYARVRNADPGALAFIHFFDEDDPDQFQFVERALTFSDSAIASDAIAPLWSRSTRMPLQWPLPADVVCHPRTAGTFGRTLRMLVREQCHLTLGEAIRRCSLVPAQILESSAPQMRRKGRLQVGCDADITVFDPATVSDRATYQDTVRTSTGFVHVLVGGRFIVRDGELRTDALPGRPIRAYP